MKFNDKYSNDGNNEDDQFKEANLQELEQQSKVLASCNYEENTLWGKEVLLPFSLTHTFFCAHMIAKEYPGGSPGFLNSSHTLLIMMLCKSIVNTNLVV